jgi:hypothetical protein
MDFNAQLTINKNGNLFLRKQEVILYTLCLNYPLLHFITISLNSNLIITLLKLVRVHRGSKT